MRLVSDLFKDVKLHREEITITDERYFTESLTFNYKKYIVHPEILQSILTVDAINDYCTLLKILDTLNKLIHDVRRDTETAYNDDDFIMYSYLDKHILRKLAEDSGFRSISLKKCKIIVQDYKYFHPDFEFYPLHYNCLGQLLKQTFSDDEVIVKLGYLVQTIRNLHKNHKHESNKLPQVDLVIC